MPDCLIIDESVPLGISFLGSGTITTRLSFLNFLWLPFCETKVNSFCFKIRIISLEDKSLRMDNIFP